MGHGALAGVQIEEGPVALVERLGRIPVERMVPGDAGGEDIGIPMDDSGLVVELDSGRGVFDGQDLPALGMEAQGQVSALHGLAQILARNGEGIGRNGDGDTFKNPQQLALPGFDVDRQGQFVRPGHGMGFGLRFGRGRFLHLQRLKGQAFLLVVDGQVGALENGLRRGQRQADDFALALDPGLFFDDKGDEEALLLGQRSAAVGRGDTAPFRGLGFPSLLRRDHGDADVIGGVGNPGVPKDELVAAGRDQLRCVDRFAVLEQGEIAEILVVQFDAVEADLRSPDLEGSTDQIIGRVDGGNDELEQAFIRRQRGAGGTDEDKPGQSGDFSSGHDELPWECPVFSG